MQLGVGLILPRICRLAIFLERVQGTPRRSSCPERKVLERPEKLPIGEREAVSRCGVLDFVLHIGIPCENGRGVK